MHNSACNGYAPQLYLSVKYPLQLFVCYVHPVTQQYKSRSVQKLLYACNQGNYYKKYNGVVCPSYHLKLKYPLPFSVSYSMFISLQSSTSQQLFE